MAFSPWSEAMVRALYAEGGFYRRAEGPGTHFRTSVHASPLFAAALLRLLSEVDAALGHPDPLDVVDVGAGRGELLVALGADASPGLRARLRLHAVEVAARPAGLPEGIAWLRVPPAGAVGLLVANEWLDNVPFDVAEATAEGPRQVLVEPATGEERAGPPLEGHDLDWLEGWWPLTHLGERAEVGRLRDEAWADAVGSLRRGVALAVDYAHTRADRLAGAVAGGTLAGHRGGRAVAPVPDGSCDVTAHVALDACAAAGCAAGAGATLLTTQREALTALGLGGARPGYDLAREDSRAYLAALARAGEAAELTDPGGLGGFGWLVQAVDAPLPASLRPGGTGARSGVSGG